MRAAGNRAAVQWGVTAVLLGSSAVVITLAAGSDSEQLSSPGFAVVTAILFAAGMLLVAGIFKTSERVDRRCAEVSEALERLANGDYSVRIKDCHGSFKEVSEALNHLAQTLDERSSQERMEYYETARLKEKSDGLEERLTTATADLSRKDVLLKEVNRELISANRSKAEFISRMGRELRLPMNTIIGLADFLLQGNMGAVNEKQREYLEKIKSRASDLLDTENKILEYSRLDYLGKPVYRELQIQKVVGDVCRSLEPYAASMDVAIEIDADDITVKADPDKLRYILYDLLHNAVKFNKPGGIARITAKKADKDTVRDRLAHVGRDCLWGDVGLVEFTVEDSGRGISPAKLAEIFKPFAQLPDRLGHKPLGAGLSLFLVRKFTELHCGRVWMEPRTGGGSRFCIAMPLQPPEETGARRTQTKKVLIVEDDPDQMAIVSAFLREEPYQLLKAEDGLDALKQLEAETPDIILLDVMLPGMEGIELCESIKRLDKFNSLHRVPVIIMTSHTDMENRLRAIRAGADDVIFKPLDKRLIIERIKSLLESKKELEDILVSYSNLEKDVLIDPLTGLFNRRHMEEVMSREFLNSKRYGRNLSVLMMDLDHFKEYNDRMGHIAGDELLRKAASIFIENVREVDIVARYGGEEFMVILPETPPDLARVAAERIRTAVEKNTDATLSIGQSSFPDDAGELSDLVRKADRALYRAKSLGRNRTVSFSEPGITQENA